MIPFLQCFGQPLHVCATNIKVCPAKTLLLTRAHTHAHTHLAHTITKFVETHQFQKGHFLNFYCDISRKPFHNLHALKQKHGLACLVRRKSICRTRKIICTRQKMKVCNIQTRHTLRTHIHTCMRTNSHICVHTYKFGAMIYVYIYLHI